MSRSVKAGLLLGVWTLARLTTMGMVFLSWCSLLAEALFVLSLFSLGVQAKRKWPLVLSFAFAWLFWSVVNYFFHGSLSGQLEETRLTVLLTQLMSSWGIWRELPLSFLVGIVPIFIFYCLIRKEQVNKSFLKISLAILGYLLFFILPFVSLEQKEAETLIYQGLEKNKLYFGKNNTELLERSFKGKNILFFMLESVGRNNLNLHDMATFMPWLKEEKSSLFMWTDVVNTFPATTRSHIPLHSGGRTITVGSPYQDLKQAKLEGTLSQLFKQNNYKTMVFSSTFWEFEHLKDYYQKMDWDEMVDPRSLEKSTEKNSWGVSEEPLLEWMQKSIKATKQPFFAFFINNSTHHPYVVEKKDFLQSSADRYRESVQLAFAQIHRTILQLKAWEKLKDTVVVIMGDHGEAFGDRHHHNFLHKNYLYQENIQNFFMLHAFDGLGQVDFFSSPIGIGDVLPLLAQTWEITSAKKFSPNKLHFFHKNSTPELFGLRDGQWKFIGHRFVSTKNELYDLSLDPEEKRNLATIYPDRIKLYRQLAFEWLWETQKEFYTWTAQKHKRLLPLESMHMTGILIAGMVKHDYDDETHIINSIDKDSMFRILMVVNPEEGNRKAVIKLKSPDGKTYMAEQVIKREWQRVWNLPQLPRPLIQGRWHVEISMDSQILKFTMQVL